MDRRIPSKQFATIVVTDPDTGAEVSVTMIKLDTGGIVGVDTSFLENTEEPVYSPFDCGVELNIYNI